MVFVIQYIATVFSHYQELARALVSYWTNSGEDCHIVCVTHAGVASSLERFYISIVVVNVLQHYRSFQISIGHGIWCSVENI